MANVTVDFNTPVGVIKPMHAGGQPPLRGTKIVDESRSWMDCEVPRLLPASSVLCMFTA